MKTGTYFKDYNMSTYVTIVSSDKGIATGRSFQALSSHKFENGKFVAKTFVQKIDFTDKVWFENMHYWEVYDSRLLIPLKKG